jgi:hypothetical protein
MRMYCNVLRTNLFQAPTPVLVNSVLINVVWNAVHEDFLAPWFDVQIYQVFLFETLPEFLEEIPLALTREM